MNTRQVTLGTVTLLFLLGCTLWAAESKAQQVLSYLHNMNVREIEISEIAQQKAQSEDVRAYASRLSLDRRKADEQIRDLAQKDDIALVPPTTSGILDRLVASKDQSTKTELLAKTGTNFDQAFIIAIIDDLHRDLNDLELAEHSIEQTDVRALIGTQFPIFEDYLKQAQQIQDKRQP